MYKIILFQALTVLLLTIAVPNLKADPFSNSYSKWQSKGERLESMISELEGVVEKASKAQAADPNFLYDLRKIIESYKIPQQTVHFFDDFSDGDLSQNPTWVGNMQDFGVDRYKSLYSSVTVKRPLAQTKQNSGNALGQLIGILSEITAESQQSPSVHNQNSSTQIYSNKTIPNAFILEYTLRPETTLGDVTIGLFQGNTAENGYRLKYLTESSAKRDFQVIKYKNGRSHIIETAAEDLVKIDDGRSHAFRWQKSPNGEMIVTIDGKPVIETTDTTYKQDFNGIVIENNGGTYSFDNIKIYTEH